MPRKKQTIPPKPFLDALYENPEGYEMPVRVKHSMFRKGDAIILKVRYSALDERRYQGELIFEQPLLQKQSRIIKPN